MKQQTPLIVLDNGASTIKAGVVNEDGAEPRCANAHPFILQYGRLWHAHNRIIPNSVVRSKGDKMTYFGHEVEHCRDFSSLHYRLPFEKVCFNSYVLEGTRWNCFSDLGIPCWLGCSESCLGWHLLGGAGSEWSLRAFLCTELIRPPGRNERIILVDNGALLQFTQYSRCIWSICIRRVRVPILPQMQS